MSGSGSIRSEGNPVGASAGVAGGHYDLDKVINVWDDRDEEGRDIFLEVTEVNIRLYVVVIRGAAGPKDMPVAMGNIGHIVGVGGEEPVGELGA